MTDYVAYVAKDPINQRGELGLWRALRALGPEQGCAEGSQACRRCDLPSLPHLGML